MNKELSIQAAQINNIGKDIERRLRCMCWNRPDLLNIISKTTKLREGQFRNEPRPKDTINW